MEKPLTLLVTQGIRGDLELLPRLYTFIKRLRAELPADSLSLLADLGESCDESVWHCGITEGRSTLFALNSMGYDAANVQGVLSAASREKLVDQVIVALVDDTHAEIIKGVRFFTPPHPQPFSPHNMGEGSRSDTLPSNEISQGGSETRPYSVSLCLTPNNKARLVDKVLYLPAVEKGQVGRVILDAGTLTYTIHTMPNDTPPDATISGTVDFVVGEARYYEKQHKERYNNGTDSSG